MDKMQKAADERESAIGPDEEETAASPAEYDISNIITEAGASDSDAAFAPVESDEEAAGDLAFASEDGMTALSPEAMATEIDTTSFVIEMDVSPTSSAEAPGNAPAASPRSAAAATLQSGAAAPTQTGAAPTPQGAAAPTMQNSASLAPQNAASPSPQKAALGPNAPAPA